MAQTSGFFDAEELVSGQYDREYVAEQWANYFKLFIGNGVFASPVNQLMVIQGTGMTITVREGWAFINGYWYHNDSDLTLNIPVNETPSSRTDGIFVQWDNADREIEIVVGVDRITVDRTAPLYELKLAEVSVAPGAIQITASDITDTRANSAVCGFVTGVVDVIDSTELFAHYQSLFDDFMSESYGTFNGFMNDSSEEFETWFDHMKDQLDSDAAGHLQNEVDILDSNKQNNDSWVNFTLLASAWVQDSITGLYYYPLNNTYSDSNYDITDVLPVSVTTKQMRKAWSAANCAGFEPTNILTVHGKVPTIDIIIGLCIRPKGKILE